MINLLKETTEVLKQKGKTWDDVIWVGCKSFKLPIEDVKTLFNVDYDNGFGGNQIAGDLLVVGKGWWLERGEYDGSEWWEFKTMPRKPRKVKKIDTISTEYSGNFDDSW